MIEITDKQIFIDGKPQIIMCGEIHYYRIDRSEWQDRIDKLKDAGCNAAASYVPWLCHEEVEGKIDLEGNTRPELDLAGFIDLCAENDLYFFLRPGPFIMAEMKNEGIPYWVIDKHPEIVPVTWDGKQTLAKTLDYSAPSFLEETKKWYAAVMEVAAPRLQPNRGNIIGVQLDNEVGMLSWVSNCPDLTDNVVDDFVGWLQERYDEETLKDRYPFILEGNYSAIRSPEDNYAAQLHFDLGYYMRHRFAKYIDTLRSYAEEFGVRDVPFIVNIHGTGGGRGFTYPIGISQLYESYTQGPGYLSGSDIYFGDLNMESFQDLYLINGFMDAVHRPEQPLTSVEFNCGDGNFGNNFSGRLDPSAADFKARMCIAQGNRLINYYLLTGGKNYRLSDQRDDGNDRIASTGERHGFAAPISPEGELNYTYPRMARSIQTIMAVSDKLAVMNEERDDVAFAFIPDYYMTEACYPNSTRMKEIYQNLEANRSTAAWENMARAMLLKGFRYGAADIQNKPIDPVETPVLAVPSACYMAREVQEKLVSYLSDGGGVLLYGEVPLYDMEGNPCHLLADAMGVRSTGRRLAGPAYDLSVYADGWAQDRAEIRVHKAQIFETGAQAEPLFRVYGTDETCGFDTKVGRGRAIVIATPYTCDLDLFTKALEKLGAKAGLKNDSKYHGVFMTSTATEQGERFLHLLNLDGFDKEMHLYENDVKLFDGRKLELQAKEGIMLPINLTVGEVTIHYATAEIRNVQSDAIHFRLTQSEDVMALKTDRQVAPSEDYTVQQEEDMTYVFSKKHAKVDDQLTVILQ
ncbi:glycoside hydrolase [Halobacillus andaensis]|uniref:Glycoside hydrolase n=1 Tax=Halobacillus andaensis TaxID=1176239 RepID=A0A917B6D9_HALAA|nr:beta-galactosidase [Halobacillus andaensis]MBP2006414.1 beta-galactosidase [Halobacillus andaensis]GGF27227.1 glycoside hydrolase [Halobacillus andaensis]